MGKGINQHSYLHPKPAEALAPRLDDDLWLLTTQTVKRALEPQSWAYVNALHKRRAEGRLSDAAFDNALITHCENLVRATAAGIAG